MPASSLRLTKIDEELYLSFRSHFAQLDISRLDVEPMKSAEGKEASSCFFSLLTDVLVYCNVVLDSEIVI